MLCPLGPILQENPLTSGTPMTKQTLRYRVARGLAVVLLTLTASACILAVSEAEAPPQIQVVQGAGQAGAVNQTLPTAIIFRAVTSNGRAVEGRQITFIVGSGGGSVTPVASETGVDGEVTVVWTLGPALSTQTIIANSPGVGPVTVQAIGTTPELLRADVRVTP